MYIRVESMATQKELFSNTATNSNSNHITEHVLKLTRNLLVLQKTGMCCDVTLQCKDGIITAHSGIDNKQIVNHILSTCSFRNNVRILLAMYGVKNNKNYQLRIFLLIQISERWSIKKIIRQNILFAS